MTDKVLLQCPPELRSVQHYLKIALDYQQREPVITYWARLYALQSAIKLDKSRSPNVRPFLSSLMDWLETFKKSNHENEAITSDVAGQAVLENEANRLFVYADSNDRAGVFNKNVVKSFYSAGVLLDVCEVFGELSEESAAQRKYAKWKATYIHNCLKSGETPIPGPIGGENDDGDISLVTPQPPPEAGVPTPSSSDAYLPPVDSSSPAHQQPGASGYQPPPAAYQPPPASAYQPPPAAAYQPQPIASSLPTPSSAPATSLPHGDIKQARKYCKWADSALDYEDIPTAVENLHKALAILTKQ